MLCFDNVTVTYNNAEPSLTEFCLAVKPGEIVALAGESGSGKTTAVRAAIGLLPGGGQVRSGEILFQGQLLTGLSHREWRTLRGRQIGMVFQDSGAMLNPIRTIGSQFIEYIRTHLPMTKGEAGAMATIMLEQMGLPHSSTIMKSYPFQLSGGMRQRVGIAMAMVFQPQLLLADEPTSALDVTTQAQIVRQMMTLRTDYGTAILMVTHNLAMAAYMADRILVLKSGRVIWQGGRDQLLAGTESGYIRELLAAVPQMKGERYV